MSKELEALSKLKNINWFCPKKIKDTLYTHYKDNFDIIEKSLKDYENLKSSRINYSSLIVKHSKELNALEIMRYVTPYEYDYLIKSWNYEEFIKLCKKNEVSITLTEEKYDLLKEVLC